jgi:hypothetical protein
MDEGFVEPLVVLYLYRVCAPGHHLVRDQLAPAAIAPLIYQQPVVHPQPRPIIDDNMEAVGTRLEM